MSVVASAEERNARVKPPEKLAKCDSRRFGIAEKIQRRATFTCERRWVLGVITATPPHVVAQSDFDQLAEERLVFSFRAKKSGNQ